MTITAEMRAQRKRAFETLGLQDDADPAKIKSTYNRLAVIYHPDKPTRNEAKFREITEAKKLLLTPLEKTGSFWSNKGHIYIFHLREVCYLAQEMPEDPNLKPYVAFRNLPIVDSLIDYSDLILESESGNVPTVIKHHGTYHETTQQYILDNAYTLNANNYTIYELLWLHVMICSGQVVLKGKLAFADPTMGSDEQYLLLHIINSHLEFRHKASAYAKESVALNTPGTFTWYFMQNQSIIITAMQCSLYSIVFPALAASLATLPAIASIAAAYIAINMATILFISFIVKSLLMPNAVYFDAVRTLEWCTETNNSTCGNMQTAFKEKQRSREEDLAPRHESVCEKVSHMWNFFRVTHPRRGVEMEEDVAPPTMRLLELSAG